MIKEALQYIVGLNKPELMSIEGQTYSDKNLSRVSYNPKAKSIKMSTLTSLVDYIKAGVDTMADNMIVQVISPLEVKLISMLDAERIREEIVYVEGSVPDFRYGSYIDNESFLIALQAKFMPSPDRDLLLKFAGTVESGTVAKYGDDGISQKATVKTGVASKSDCIVPNPVRLIPFRTFMEVGQPESSFIFRMRDDNQLGIQCAIFEADGGAWKNVEMTHIKDYLVDELEDINAECFNRFTVIS